MSRLPSASPPIGFFTHKKYSGLTRNNQREVNQWLYQLAQSARKGPPKKRGETTLPQLPQKEMVAKAATSFLEGIGRREVAMEIAEDCKYEAVLAGMTGWFREGITEVLRKEEEDIEAKYPCPKGTGYIQQASRHITESLCGRELWEREAHIDAIYRMNDLEVMSMVQIGNRNVFLCFAQERYREKTKELTFHIALSVAERTLQGQERESFMKSQLSS